jgi:hypothetical protein
MPRRGRKFLEKSGQDGRAISPARILPHLGKSVKRLLRGRYVGGSVARQPRVNDPPERANKC